MREREQSSTRARHRLSEDWIAVIVGLAIILVVALLGASSIPWPLFGVLR